MTAISMDNNKTSVLHIPLPSHTKIDSLSIQACSRYISLNFLQLHHNWFSQLSRLTSVD